MRKIFAAVVAASAIMSPMVASAGSFVSTGIVESVNAPSNTVRIQGGDIYKLPADVNAAQFHAGQRVNVSWNSQNVRTVGFGGGQFISGVVATGISLAQ